MEALVLGGSGLVGSELLRQLNADAFFTSIISLGRKELAAPLPPTFHCDVVFCCLGTTIKVAGSQEAFREVDHYLPIRIARAALEKGAQHYIIVSAMGADVGSRIFYNRVKGEMEAELRSLGYPHVTIIHPSLLLGERKEPRWGEKIGSVLMRVFSPLIPKNWQAVHVRNVARVMVESAKHPRDGVRVINNAEIVAA
ncbi:MAG TPA: NAD(P)H-binding protein [Candidatus Didemnitutus sp.]|nr:NAD(P)H-binding protein [Candidatus Didemnitutus sp.]